MRAALATLLSVLLVAGPAAASRQLARAVPETRVRGLKCPVVVLVPVRVVATRDAASGKLRFAYEVASESSLWDKDNRLRSVTQPSGVSAFDYDANGLRVRRVEGGVETRYLLDGASVLEEFDGAGAVKATFLNNPQAIDDVLAMNIGGQAAYPLVDALGSLYALTDSTGAIVRRQDFEVYGERTSSTGTGPATDRGYTSREHDAWGGVFNRDRERNPKLGSWLQPDRLGVLDGPNLYSYVRGNPVLFVDATGLLTLLLYGDPNKIEGLWAVTRSNKTLSTWYLTEGNWIGYRDAAKEYISRRYGIPLAEISAFPFFRPEHIRQVESLTTVYDTVVYFGHGSSSALFPDYMLWQTTQGGYMEAKDAATIFVRNVRKPPNRIILEGCYTQGFATQLGNEISTLINKRFQNIDGLSSSLNIVIRVEDDAYNTPYRLDAQ